MASAIGGPPSVSPAPGGAGGGTSSGPTGFLPVSLIASLGSGVGGGGGPGLMTSASSTSTTAVASGAGGTTGHLGGISSGGGVGSVFRPVPMKLFATWEVDRTPPNCIPR